MVTYDILDADIAIWNEDTVLATIRKLAQEFGLLVKEETTLLSKKGSTHCHLGHPQYSGLLEITVWPPRNAIWIDIHANRRTGWNEAMIEPVAQRLADRFGGHAKKRNS
ncbi:hypothetical protein [Sulfobacillus thermosulfidooxidans]|uniref:hypothetical protein n=1 Tax=Sulfobacillus thermosulfidooxidans TaxID=28034 RepID=UPI0006B58131|nr:hypothetical protein [Sulfobacillus thermosulfidooxidans]